ncbi:MAG: sugar transferase [Erysipelotrichaceae bacterium]|nr:sugar transferase [Erysipelotrichaceae bacterium]
MYKPFFKRFYDIFLSLFALIVLSPLLIAISIVARIKMGKGIIFKQKRIGKNNKEFKLLKFRTMLNTRDENGVFLPDDQRVTKFGNFLRKTSIDELPSLLNILKGDMSIIGPRPLPVRYLPRYNEHQIRRHEVRPGLSNPATTHGRNSQSWEEQFDRDVKYVDSLSMWVDIKSIFATIKVVLTKEGAVADDNGARGEFIGTADPSTLGVDDEGNFMKIK